MSWNSVSVAPAVKVVPGTYSDATAWFRFMHSILYFGSSTKERILYQLQLLGQIGYDSLSRCFCDEVKPVRELSSIEVGESAEVTITISKWRIFFFALASGDWNRLHFDTEFASKTRFGEPIGHGLIGGGVVSALLGMELPGLGTYWISQTWKFKGPMKIGDEVVVRVTIIGVDQERRRFTLTTIARVGDKVVTEGVAVVGLDEFPYINI